MNFEEWYLDSRQDSARDVLLGAFEAGAQSQQTKIEEINEVANGWKDEYRIMSLRYERSKKRIDELQIKIAFQEKAIKNIKLQFENKQIDCDRSDRKIDELQARIDDLEEEISILHAGEDY